MNETSFTQSLEINIALLKQTFSEDNTIVFRFIGKDRFCAVFLDGMVNTEIINIAIIKPLISIEGIDVDKPLSDILLSNETEQYTSLNEAISALLTGDTLVFMEGLSSAIGCNTKGAVTRSITEPDNERNLKGPREGFSELLITNISMMRRKLQTADLKFEMTNLGARSRTKICICYLSGLADQKILRELKRRLGKIDIDGIIDVNYIEEIIKDHRFSPFKTIGSTEKPDIAAAKLLEGRIAVLVDGTPIVLTLPYLFVESFQSNDDYYLNFIFASIGRVLRFFGFLVTVTLPALYVSLLCYHQEIIPRSLLIHIAHATGNIPFPTIVECFMMLVVFEILRETGVRMPGKMGSALSIVGALVLGQAAVESGIVSNSIVIIIALAGITELLVPKLKGAITICRLLCLFAASILGMYGLFFALMGILLSLAMISSFGVDYLEGFGTPQDQQHKDILWRAPFWSLTFRPSFAGDKKRRGEKP